MVAMEFDSTMGHLDKGPPRVSDFFFMERCSECDFTAWRVSRAGKAGKCELCKNDRKGGTEMVKCRVCAADCVRRATTWRRERENRLRHLLR